MRMPRFIQMKYGRRLVSLASILVGLALLGYALRLNHVYESTMPRQSDKLAGRTTVTTVSDGTRIFVTDAEARGLEHAQTYLTFGWPFLVLGFLLGVTTSGKRDAIEPGADANVLWTDRR
jgi:hypothetical protein